MTPKIESIKPKTLVGLHVRMTLAENKTSELWRAFLPRAQEINNRSNTLRYSIQVYDATQDITTFTPQTAFSKWAAVEASLTEPLPDGMSSITIPEGKYAVFIHHGAASEFAKTFQFIFGKWLPSSGYQFDNRPQFEVMQADYNPFDENAMEEVWIPIR